MFDCGINETIGDMVSSIETEKEKLILKAVQSVGIDVDKEQLEKALLNAKSFYDDGYRDAKKQYERKWTPCSEKPPEESGVYYAIYEWQDCYMYTYMYYDGQSWYEGDTWNKEWRKAQTDPFAYVGIPSRYMQVDKGLQERFEYSVKKEVEA